jgi:hypothetical protein
MKIVSKAVFLSMPVGTVYCEFVPMVFEDLQIYLGRVGDYNDFVSKPLWAMDTAAAKNDYVIAHEAMAANKSIELDFDSTGRDGMNDDAQLYAVFERKDLLGLVNQLISGPVAIAYGIE